MPPTNLIEMLQALRRKVKLFGVLYGTCLVVACAVGLLLTVVLFDWLLALPVPLRLAVNFSALVALGYALYHWVGREAMRKQTLSDLAGRLEHAFPHFQDVLRSTVEFVRPTRGEIPGSEVMKQRTIAEAVRRTSEVDLDRAIVLKPVWYSGAMATGAVLLVLGLVVVGQRKFPDLMKIAANRLLGGTDAWPKSTELDMVGEVPRRIPAGQVLDLHVRDLKHNAHHAIMRYSFDDRNWTENGMAQSGDTFNAQIATPAASERDKTPRRLHIRIEAGDDVRDMYVDVVQRLDISQVLATVQPPHYAGAEASVVNITGNRVVTAVQASTVDLRVSFNKPLDPNKSVVIKPAVDGGPTPAVSWSFPNNGREGDGGVAVGRLVARRPASPATRPSSADVSVEQLAQTGGYDFTITATDLDGFQNSSPVYSVAARDDAMPTVTIQEPKEQEDVHVPSATFLVAADVTDDFGIDDVQLVVSRTSGQAPQSADSTVKPTTQPGAVNSWIIPLHTARLGSTTVDAPGVRWEANGANADGLKFLLNYTWNLGDLPNADLRPGDTVQYYVRVKDNFDLPGAVPAEHAFVNSSPIKKIHIISDPEWNNYVESRLSDMRNELKQIKVGQDRIHDESKGQAEQATQRAKFDDAQRATASRLGGEQVNTANQTKQSSEKINALIKKMEENKSPDKGTRDVVAEVAKDLEHTATSPMLQATTSLSQAKDTHSDPQASPAQQKQDATVAAGALSKATESQAQASDELAKAIAKLGDFGSLDAMTDKIAAIKKAQEELDKKYEKQMHGMMGKTQSELTEAEKKQVDSATAEQKEIKKDTDKAISALEAKSAQQALTDPAASQAMKAAAGTGKAQGIMTHQQEAAEQMEQNQQSDAQASQKQVELGLEMMLEKLKQAQLAKLAQLRENLEQLAQRVDLLMTRQSGHNLDDLSLLDPTGKKIADLAVELRTNLFTWSKRDPAAAIKADLEVLTSGQEMTERTTRDVAHAAESLPDPSASSKLTAAATKMEQAIVYLRNKQLADAYEPSQADAMNLLKEAKEKVAEQLKKAQEDEKDHEEDTIRQAYVKLLEGQKDLDSQTVRIDKSRDADGNVPRAEQVNLNNLPGKQSELASKATKLGDDLEDIGSSVLVWANKDIVTTMAEVKESLTKPETGVPTQAEQQRIEEQLNSIITVLDRKVQPQKFHGRGGGGGGGSKGPPPKVPTDMELRLLKALQVAVDKSTVKIAADKQLERDSVKLVALGGREGSLRGVFDALLKKNTQIQLDPPPKDDKPLAEEGGEGAIDDIEWQKNLLDDSPGEEEVTRTVKLVGDRMARINTLLAKNKNPGDTTQTIEKRVEDSLDALILLAQKQEAPDLPGSGQQANSERPERPDLLTPGDGSTGGPGKGKGKGAGHGMGQGGTQSAGDSHEPNGSAGEADLSRELKELGKEWGNLSPRERQAIMEASGEKSFTKYDKLLKDYYRDLAKKSSEH